MRLKLSCINNSSAHIKQEEPCLTTFSTLRTSGKYDVQRSIFITELVYNNIHVNNSKNIYELYPVQKKQFFSAMHCERANCNVISVIVL